MKAKKWTALLLALALVFVLVACGSSSEDESETEATETEGTSQTAEEEAIEEETGPAEEEEADTEEIPAEADAFEGTDINIAVLTGPTGVGAVGLMEANDAGETVNSYSFTAAAANDEITAGVISGEYDIAAIATNLAATLWNRTEGGVQICALNTYGVLYILENGDEISSVADLEGKTIYTTGQGANPEYVLDYVLRENGLTPGEDVEIVFDESATVQTMMADGDIDLCMLPVPAATSVLMQNEDVHTALDMTEEWEAVSPDGQLTMGCIVVNREFAQENPEAVDAFLTEYAASIDSVLSDSEHAAELCETYGIVPQAAVALRAIPDCSLCCVTGEEIQTTIEPYFNVLYDANPDSVGGTLPDIDFYYISE